MVSSGDLNDAARFINILQATGALVNLRCILSHVFKQPKHFKSQNVYCHCKGKNKEYISHRGSFL